MRSAAKLQLRAGAGARSTAGPTRPPAPCSAAVLEPLYAAYRGGQARARRARSRSISICRSARSCSTAHGTVDRVITPRAPRRAPADRGIHDPRQRRGGRDAGARAHAADLSRARRARPGAGRTRCANSSQTLDISLPKGGALRAEQFNRILARVKGRDVEKLVNEVVLRTPGAGRICRRELRAFRPQPAPLRAFHLADPPLRRPDRASRR